MEAVLLIAAVLIYVGYLAVRTSRHLRVPVVTSFLVLGVMVLAGSFAYLKYRDSFEIAEDSSQTGMESGKDQP